MLSVSILTKVVYTCNFSMVRDFSFVYYMLELSTYMSLLYCSGLFSLLPYLNLLGLQATTILIAMPW